ncbi:MAG: L,D-transpeptidase family protein [Candidatus Melainabacteria bacterium]|nr:L,D-transpeptidase family protein [Candidatus Melainabacteria bacterium]
MAKPKISHSDAIDKYKPKVEVVLKSFCSKQDLSYPPKHLYLVGLKAEKELRVYAADKNNNASNSDERSSSRPKLIHTYDIIAASGDAGPKLKEGDWQVPEGFYKIDSFNPNSLYHLSLRVNYPNQEDKAHAESEKRTKLGGDIMIHGSNASVGCLAMGDDAIEEIYVLVSDVGRENVDVILAPCNLARSKPKIKMDEQPRWLSNLYKRLTEFLSELG